MFVQIGDENVHRVRAILDEVFGNTCFCAAIVYQKAPYATSTLLPPVYDTLLWYSRTPGKPKYRTLFEPKNFDSEGTYRYVDPVLDSAGAEQIDKSYQSVSIISPGSAKESHPLHFRRRNWSPPAGSHWKTTIEGLSRVNRADRLLATENSVRFKSRLSDFRVSIRHNNWTDTITG